MVNATAVDVEMGLDWPVERLVCGVRVNVAVKLGVVGPTLAPLIREVSPGDTSIDT